VLPVLRQTVPLVKNIEALSSAETRALFALAAIGRAVIYTNLNNYAEEIVEVFIVSAGVNTVQLLAKGLPLTAAIPMAANQAYTDPGIALLFPGESLEIITGAANPVVGHVRQRVTPYVA
jgi:hypothetical protein